MPDPSAPAQDPLPGTLRAPGHPTQALLAEPGSPRPHARFFSAFLWVALTTAIGGGFALAGHLSFVLGFGYPLSASFPALVQAHGHAQLLGWCGVLIMGVSLHFIPRLAGSPLAHPHWPNAIVWCMAAGLLFRMVGQLTLPYAEASATRDLLRGAVVASGGMETIGILLYVVLLLDTLRGRRGIALHPGFVAVRPWLAMALAGWLLHAVATDVALVHMAVRHTGALDPAWNGLAIQSFQDLTLLPVGLAFSVRLLPMYLALSAPFWRVRETAYGYLLGSGLQLIPAGLDAVGIAGAATGTLVALGAVVKGSALLWFTWKLDVLTRVRPLERPARFLHAGPDRPPTRPGLPDFGEFGRFERLVYSAYVWLVVAAGLEIAGGVAGLLGAAGSVNAGATRHLYLLGFITLLIFGVAPRMLPGFLRKRRLAAPGLVTATFWLGNLAVISRMTPAVVPAGILPPAADGFVRAAYGLSGTIALAAVVLLAVNLLRTARRKGQCPARRRRHTGDGPGPANGAPGPSEVLK